MRGLYFAAKGRPAQDQLPIAKLHGVSQIRMPTRELRDAEVFCLTWEMHPKERLEFGEVELLAPTDGGWFVSEVRHFHLPLHGYRWVSNASPSKCGNELKELSVKR